MVVREPVASRKHLSQALRGDPSGVLLVKPRVIFASVEEKLGRPVDMVMPVPSSSIGSVSLLEAAILTSVLKLLQPTGIFEFGTFLGFMTRVFATNSQESTRIFSLDLPASAHPDLATFSQTDVLSDFRTNDAYLSALQSVEGAAYLGQDLPPNVTLIKEDSRFFAPSDYGLDSTCELVFVDGGHSEAVARADTENAFRLLNSPGCIAWHDFRSSLHTEVDSIVNQVAESRPVIHIESTMLALCLTEEAVDLLCD